MSGTITVTKVVPQLGKSLIYFEGTSDNDAKLNFSAYKSVDFIDAVVAETLVSEPATAYTAGGDITFTTTGTATGANVKGIAIVNF